MNLCDCCSYALAALSGEPLLFKGNDFSATDITPVFGPVTAPRPTVITITLSRTYYQQGFVNIPAAFADHFGPHDSTIDVDLNDPAVHCTARINRTAQRNGSPRILGGPQLRAFFERHCECGDRIDIVVEPNRPLRIRPHR